MQSIITICLMGVSLSLDAFSLSLIYGTLNPSKKIIIILSTTVGLYHLIMPLLGSLIGEIIIKNLFFLPNQIVGFLFMLIAIEMVFSVIKEERTMILNVAGILLFGLAVSIDSFLTGIGLGIIYVNVLPCALVFMLFSTIFTYMGLMVGGKINHKFGKYSTLLGGVILITIAMYYLTK